MIVFKAIFPFLCVSLLCSCQTVVDNHGYDFEISDISKVTMGQTKEQVLETLGSPSSLSTFNDDAWYYISKKTAKKSFFTPKTLDQKVLVVRFKNDIVSAIEEVGKENARNITPSKEETKTSGQEIGIMKEVFGNFGKFSSPKGPTKS